MRSPPSWASTASRFAAETSSSLTSFHMRSASVGRTATASCTTAATTRPCWIGPSRCSVRGRRATTSAWGWGSMWKGRGSGRTKARMCRCWCRARWSRPRGSPTRGRPTPPSGRRSWPTSSVSTSPTSRSRAATRASSSGGWARSPRGARSWPATPCILRRAWSPIRRNTSPPTSWRPAPPTWSEAAAQFTSRPRPGPPLLEGEQPGLEATGYYSPPGSTWAAGCHAAYVHIDPKTFRLEVLKYVVVHDCGRLINPMVVEGQIEGGVAQGIGGAFYERLAYDADGQLRNASFMEFLMPYATEVPSIEIDHVETPSPLNPLGVKGAGEAGVIPVGAVIGSAVEDALGIPITEMPLSPLKLYELSRSSPS